MWWTYNEWVGSAAVVSLENQIVEKSDEGETRSGFWQHKERIVKQHFGLCTLPNAPSP